MALRIVRDSSVGYICLEGSSYYRSNKGDTGKVEPFHSRVFDSFEVLTLPDTVWNMQGDKVTEALNTIWDELSE